MKSIALNFLLALLIIVGFIKAVFEWGAEKTKRKEAEKDAKQAKKQAQDFADMPVTDDDAKRRLRDRIMRKRKAKGKS